MRYQVPQFIEVEDKIFGPLTIKQFLYVAGGSAIFFIIWSVFPRIIAIIFGLPILVFFIALAFLKMNSRPMVLIVESAFSYFFSPKLYLWRKTPKSPNKKDTNSISHQAQVPKLSESKLKDLSWGLDIKKKLN